MTQTIHAYREDAQYKKLASLLKGYPQEFIDELYLCSDFDGKEGLLDQIEENGDGHLTGNVVRLTS